jgi:hypothetical protein
MDAPTQSNVPDPIMLDQISVTGSGSCVLAPGETGALNVLPFLKSRKMRKFMGKQDQLAVVAASLSLQGRALSAEALRERTGIYLTVGYIPFERDDIEAMARHSVEGGRFSMQRFSTDGIEQVNPLLTFRCLPNMPAFHVSLNCGIQGPYFVTYPGAGQFYLALERAIAALSANEIDYALVGAVADQDNFLVEFDRAHKSSLRDRAIRDAGAFLLLERGSCVAGESPALELQELQVRYRPHDPWAGASAHQESFLPDCIAEDVYLGAASLPTFLDKARRSNQTGELTHRIATGDGIEANSRWRTR